MLSERKLLLWRGGHPSGTGWRAVLTVGLCYGAWLWLKEPSIRWALIPLALLFGAEAVARAWRARRQAQARRANPAKPWEWDYPWNPAGESDHGAQEAKRNLLASALIVGSALALWLAFAGVELRHGSGRVEPFLQAVILALATAWLALSAQPGLRLWSRCKYGACRLRFSRFPFLTGAPFEAELEVPRFSARPPRIRATLRFVEERTEGRPRLGLLRVEWAIASYSPRVYAIYEETKEFERDAGGSYRVSFFLHEKFPGTELDRWPKRYWLLELSGEAPGVDLRAAFFVPIYAKKS